MDTQVNQLTRVPPEIVYHWGLFLAFGLGLIGLSILAAIRSARGPVASVYFFGWLLIVASGIEAGDSYMTGGWTGFYLHLVGAILFGAILFGVTG